MKINELEEKINNLKERGILPKGFSLQTVSLKKGEVKKAYGVFKSNVYKWNKDGLGFLSTDATANLSNSDNVQLSEKGIILYKRYNLIDLL